MFLRSSGTDSEVLLKPRAIYKDPFRRGDNILGVHTKLLHLPIHGGESQNTGVLVALHTVCLPAIAATASYPAILPCPSP